jgi:hypothetical protein
METTEDFGKEIRRVDRRLRRIEVMLNRLLQLVEKSPDGSDAPTATPSQALTLLHTKRLPSFARDAEVFALVHSMVIDGHTIDAIRVEVQRAFGTKRVPARSTVGRYRKRILEAWLS